MALNHHLLLRAAQGFLALLILGLMAFVVSDWHHTSYYTWSPSQAKFFLFTACWTLLAVVYLAFAPARFPDAAHKFAILGVEFVTMIFWFAGWVALAVLLGDIGCGSWTACQVAEAATVFGAFEWLLFVITMVISALHVWRTRDGNYSSKSGPTVHAAV